MKRFLVSEKLVEGATILLDPAEAKHATRVLRLQVGDEIVLTDGRGAEASARLVNIGKEETRAQIFSVRASSPIRGCRLELLQAPLKGARMDWLIEKLTELGLDAIHPVLTQFTVAQNDKEDRWARLVQSAVKQSGNPRLMEIAPLVPLSEAIAALPESLKILLSPGAPLSLSALLRAQASSAKRIFLAIGPEGGFSAEEETALEAKGFVRVALSPQILRGETAAISAVAITLHLIDF
jgi:16S rRNA (uracil1498-N3)-methyltransferase